MRRAAIVAPVRTPVGKFQGALASVPVEKLAAAVVKETIARAKIDPARIEDVIFAQSYASGETPCTGRWAALEAGLPIEVPGLQLDRRCGGGLQAVLNAAMMVQSGAADVVIAGGVESMSNVEYYTTAMRGGARAGNATLYDRLERGRERSQPEWRFGKISGMIETAENLARDYQISREAADAYAVQSQQRAAAAWNEGRFAEELVPITVSSKKGEVVVDRDEGVRADATLESLAALKPMLKAGVSTAGNSSQQNDAAAACLVVAEDQLAALNLTPMGYLVGWAAVGCEPATMGIGPVPATAKLFAKTGLSLKDMDVIELNEAFAAQVLAVLKGWGLSAEDPRLNPNGSGISLGHPIAATGARIVATLLHDMRRRGARYGLETMCVGGGQGVAAVFERA
jgi:acetyl-CoA C-acetyltransferase